MIAILVSFDLLPGCAAEFLELIKSNARQSLAREPGCEVFDVLTLAAKPDHVDLYERYSDRESFDSHCRSAHFLAFDRASGPLVRRKWATEFNLIELPETA